MRHGIFGRGRIEQERGDWEGWTPPWMNEEGHGFGPRHFAKHMRREFFGRRGHFGPGGHFGEGRHFFGRGDFKFVVLKLLQERPMHGYEIIKTLEEKSNGFYSPSAGSIYPTLQMLEDRSLVTAVETEGKKVYSITDAGRELLAQHEKETEYFAGPPWGRGHRWNNPEIQALRSEAMEVVRLFTIAGRTALYDQERQGRLRAILADARKSLSDMIYGATAASTSDTPKE